MTGFGTWPPLATFWHHCSSCCLSAFSTSISVSRYWIMRCRTSVQIQYMTGCVQGNSSALSHKPRSRQYQRNSFDTSCRVIPNGFCSAVTEDTMETNSARSGGQELPARHRAIHASITPANCCSFSPPIAAFQVNDGIVPFLATQRSEYISPISSHRW